MVLLDEEPDARRQKKDAGIEKRPDLEPDRDEVAARDAEEVRRRRVGKEPFLLERANGLDDLGLHAALLRYFVSIPSAIVTFSFCFAFVFPYVSVTV